MSQVRLRWELIAAVALAALSALTLLWPEWIEASTGMDPDAGSGAAEAGIVVAFAIAAAAIWIRRHLRLRRLDASAPHAADSSTPAN